MREGHRKLRKGTKNMSMDRRTSDPKAYVDSLLAAVENASKAFPHEDNGEEMKTVDKAFGGESDAARHYIASALGHLQEAMNDLSYFARRF